jgi:multiple sugar transport system ATP-binding protein
VEEVARLLGLEKLLERKPAQLSGGQRQRVAMGRAIVREPQAFLMDEPLSNLDAKLRVGMRASLARLHARLGVTTVYVTHDQTEAMTLGQRVAVMRDGRIVQADRPQRLYEEPQDLFVAAFIGSPPMNLVEASIEDDHVVFGHVRIPLDGRRRPASRAGHVVLGIRPEAFDETSFAAPHLPRLDVRADVVEELGADAHVFFAVDAKPVVVEARDGADDPSVLAEGGVLFNARVEPSAPVRAGTTARLAVDPAKFHFFDPETGATLLAAGASQPVGEPVVARS